MISDEPAAAQFLLGLHVLDRDDEDPDPAAVINVPGVPADEWDIDDEHTVASNPATSSTPTTRPSPPSCPPTRSTSTGWPSTRRPLN